ncbi:MAG: PQQ-dependent sugar dehydrogenase [Gemmataceae bacterium]|nr:PQQ-dependent sugar dehydrogenase [Gemmataceae bacterium]
MSEPAMLDAADRMVHNAVRRLSRFLEFLLMIRSSAFLFALFAGLASAIASDDAPAKKAATPIECRFTELPIRIDGKADDDAWKHAVVIDGFRLPWLGDQSRPAKTATRAKLLWDRDYLYFFADMDDTDLCAQVKEHDGPTWQDDVFELFFKPSEEHAGYYEFQVNPAGTVLDMFLPRRGAGGFERFAKDGDFHVEAKVHLRGTLNDWTDKDKGWSVEGRIPWTDFLRTGGRPKDGETWKFALCRYDYSVDFEGPELSTIAPLRGPVPNFHKHEDYASLVFVGPAKSPGIPQAAITNWKSAPSKVTGSPEGPSPYRIKRIFTDLKIPHPIAITHQPGSDSMIAIHQPEPGGASNLVRFENDPKVKDFETILTIDGTAYEVVFHPGFAKNGWFFVGHKGPAKGPTEKKKAAVTRYAMDPKTGKFDPASAKVILDWASDGHDGLAMGFGLDGMFYLTTGDGTSDSDTNVVGQDMSSLLAKLLRIDVDHPEPGKTYSVPKDNPFVGMKGARPEIWALGFRNPWRLAVDKKTSQVWVGQNGQDLFEQAMLVKKGDNFGWSVNEGSQPFYPLRKKGPNFLTQPTIEHPHSEFRSLTGGPVYYGSRLPELQGAYIYGDYSTGRIWAMKHDGAKAIFHHELVDTSLAITSFGTDHAGELVIADYRRENAGFYALEARPAGLAPPPFPTKLSDSGLFRSVKGHVVAEGLIPYSVNSVLWSDGAGKQRWIHLPADARIDTNHDRGWSFPDQTTIVKSFFLDLEEGNPATRKWIETRFLTKQDGEWFGYSYAWNEDETEGTLVASKGADRDFTIKTPSGNRKQTWRYPSRAECMMCHSRAANYVLGLQEVQLNKVHDYDGKKEHQLRVLEHLGLLKVNYSKDIRRLVSDELKAKAKSEEEAKLSLKKATDTRDQRPIPSEARMLSHGPERYRKLVDPSDKAQDLTLRVRSYLHSNCAQCHVEAGGGNAAMELEFITPLEKMRVIGVKPVHDTFGIANAKIVDPGHPERSILLQRISHRGKGHMPPLATSRVDDAAVEMIREWIAKMPAEKK